MNTSPEHSEFRKHDITSESPLQHFTPEAPTTNELAQERAEIQAIWRYVRNANPTPTPQESAFLAAAQYDTTVFHAVTSYLKQGDGQELNGHLTVFDLQQSRRETSLLLTGALSPTVDVRFKYSQDHEVDPTIRDSLGVIIANARHYQGKTWRSKSKGFRSAFVVATPRTSSAEDELTTLLGQLWPGDMLAITCNPDNADLRAAAATLSPENCVIHQLSTVDTSVFDPSGTNGQAGQCALIVRKYLP